MSLTEKEKLVFFGLTRYPYLNDRELAERLKLNLPTVTAIRNRLIKRGLFKPYRIPFLPSFDVEILVVEHKFMPSGIEAESLPAEKKAKEVPFAKRRKKEKEELGEGYRFFHIKNGRHEISLFIYPNYTIMKKMVRERELSERVDYTSLAPKKKVVIFPLSLSIISNYFDFSPILKEVFGIPEDMDEPRPFVIPFTKHQGPFTPNEGSILRAMVKNPFASDSALSEELEVTRHTVSKMHKKFEREGLLRRVIIPHLGALGIDLFCVAVIRFNSMFTLKDRLPYAEVLFGTIPAFFWITSEEHCVILSALPDYETVERFKNYGESLYIQRGFFAEPVDITVFSTQNFTPSCGPKFEKTLEFILDRPRHFYAYDYSLP